MFSKVCQILCGYKKRRDEVRGSERSRKEEGNASLLDMDYKWLFLVGFLGLENEDMAK